MKQIANSLEALLDQVETQLMDLAKQRHELHDAMMALDLRSLIHRDPEQRKALRDNAQRLRDELRVVDARGIQLAGLLNALENAARTYVPELAVVLP